MHSLSWVGFVIIVALDVVVLFGTNARPQVTTFRNISRFKNPSLIFKYVELFDASAPYSKAQRPRHLLRPWPALWSSVYLLFPMTPHIPERARYKQRPRPPALTL